ncbi:MAG: efflux RND transporter periplasmic adaptor subunit [Sedimentisphaerales bacterium]|nr:efflux RND transporter periplasmic adaptor subunit [Sedimentisphaerales bacterium]
MTALPDTRQIAELMAKLSRFAGSNPEPPQFFANFLQMIIAATAGKGGAIWVLQPEKGPQCYCHLNLELSKLDVASQQELLNHAIQKTVEEGKSMLIPPQTDTNSEITNICGHCLLFKPLRAGGKVAMILQVICDPALDSNLYRPMVGIADQAAEIAETYLAHRRAVVLDDDRKSLSKLLSFSEKVHNGLEPEKVIYQAVNLGREALNCQRMVIWVDPRVKKNLQAVSGVDKPDRRAVLMQAIDKLSRFTIREKKPVLASRQQLVEMPDEQELTSLLKNYFNISQLDQIYLYPLVHNDRYLGVIAAEGLQEAAGNLEGMITAIATHTAVALNNALEMADMPVMKPLARLKKLKNDPKRKRKIIIRSLVALVAVLICLLLPWSVNIKGDCKLTPQVMRTLVSPLDGAKVKEVIKTEGFIAQGQQIVQLDDFDLNIELRGLKLAMDKERVNFRRGNLSAVEKENSQLEINRISNEIKLKEEMIQRCKIQSPINGTILTPMLDRIVGNSLQRGQEICTLADLNNWQLVISVPQQEIEWVRLAAQTEGSESQSQQVEIDFVLEAFPQQKLKAYIERPDQVAYSAQTLPTGNIFEVRVDLSPEALEAVKLGLRDGMEGSAKIKTVNRPLGYVLIRKVLRFFRLTFF